MSFPLNFVFHRGLKINVTLEGIGMKKMPRLAYWAEFKEQAVKRVKDGQTIVVAAKELGLNS